MEIEQHACYTRYASRMLGKFMNYEDSSIRISFKQLKRMSHEHIMNRVAMCRQEYADAMFIHFINFSLVLVYGNAAWCVRDYFSMHNSGDLSMTEFKRTKDYKWIGEVYSRSYVTINNGGKETFHLWRQPHLIRAKTDRVSRYYKIWKNGELIDEGNNFGDSENFYIIGSIHY